MDQARITGSFGDRLRTVRQAWGWTQEQMGQALNTDQTTISAWEREKIQPRGPALAAAAQLLGLPMEVLAAGSSIEINIPPAPKPVLPSTEAPILIQLPVHSPAITDMIDLATDTSEPLFDTQEAILRLISASRHGRKVWILVK